MLNQLMLLGQQTREEMIETVSKQTQDTSVPESAIEHAGTYWFPESASSFAPAVDSLYMIIFWICVFFFAGIVAAMIYLVIRYRRVGNEINPEPSTSHNTWLEIAWSVLPSILLVYIFWEGANGWFDMRIAPEDAEEIHVTARKWNWQFTYPDGDISNELHLVLDRPVKLVMRSDDVLHSMFIPAFRQKVDVVPGRYTYAYLMPTRVGQYRLACTEYCGDEHSNMRTMCEVHIDEEDRKTTTEWKSVLYKPWKNGERLFKINCSGCHDVEGVAKTGPELNLIWGETENFTNAEPLTVDENYIRESILYPNAKIVEGYLPKMNSFEGKLSDAQIDQLIAYIKHLKVGDPTDDGILDPEAAAADEAAQDDGESSDGEGEDDESGDDADNSGEAAREEDPTPEEEGGDDSSDS